MPARIRGRLREFIRARRGANKAMTNLRFITKTPPKHVNWLEKVVKKIWKYLARDKKRDN